jgi:LemA protein
MVRIFLILLLLGFSLNLTGCGYNSLQVKEEKVFKAWADVEATLQRRGDLIPNLVETVKGYARHERETLQAVIEARSAANSARLTPEELGSAEAMTRFQAAQGGLSSALGRLMLIVERYPELKANQNFLDLQTQLEGTENRINVARQRYNAAVEVFNSSIRQFPASITNTVLLHLDKKEYFKSDARKQTAPEIKF